MKSRLKLNAGERLVQESHRLKGTLQETDIYTYAIHNAADEKVGSVVHTEHTAIRGFRVTQTVEQCDSAGKVIVSETW